MDLKAVGQRIKMAREAKGLTQEDLELEPYDLLEAIGKKRGMLMSGGAVNTERAAIMLVDEFRASKIGRISLERPEDL